MLDSDSFVSTGVRSAFMFEGSLPPLRYDQETTRICLEEGQEGPYGWGWGEWAPIDTVSVTLFLPCRYRQLRCMC